MKNDELDDSEQLTICNLEQDQAQLMKTSFRSPFILIHVIKTRAHSLQQMLTLSLVPHSHSLCLSSAASEKAVESSKRNAWMNLLQEQYAKSNTKNVLFLFLVECAFNGPLRSSKAKKRHETHYYLKNQTFEE